MEAKDYLHKNRAPVMLSMLTNEGCWGNCPIMPEHYHYNSTRVGSDPQYFNSDISRVSCSSWDVLDTLHHLRQRISLLGKKIGKRCLIWVSMFSKCMVEKALCVEESMDIIDRWDANQELLFPGSISILTILIWKKNRLISGERDQDL